MACLAPPRPKKLALIGGQLWAGPTRAKKCSATKCQMTLVALSVTPHTHKRCLWRSLKEGSLPAWTAVGRKVLCQVRTLLTRQSQTLRSTSSPVRLVMIRILTDTFCLNSRKTQIIVTTRHLELELELSLKTKIIPNKVSPSSSVQWEGRKLDKTSIILIIWLEVASKVLTSSTTNTLTTSKPISTCSSRETSGSDQPPLLSTITSRHSRSGGQWDLSRPSSRTSILLLLLLLVNILPTQPIQLLLLLLLLLLLTTTISTLPVYPASPSIRRPEEEEEEGRMKMWVRTLILLAVTILTVLARTRTVISSAWEHEGE